MNQRPAVGFEAKTVTLNKKGTTWKIILETEDPPDYLLAQATGGRYMVAMAPIADNEEVITQEGVDTAAQAERMCANESFQLYIAARFDDLETEDWPDDPYIRTAVAVCNYCQAETLEQIEDDPQSYKLWSELLKGFLQERNLENPAEQ